MYVDAVASMLIYTTTTAAFYLLGAAVLHKRGQIPEDSQIIAVLSGIYTETLGPGAMGLFLAAAVTVLFSTLFVACASSTRMFTDAFRAVRASHIRGRVSKTALVRRAGVGLACDLDAIVSVRARAVVHGHGRRDRSGGPCSWLSRLPRSSFATGGCLPTCVRRIPTTSFSGRASRRLLR